MSEQYFTKQPQSKSNPKTWSFELRGFMLTFTTDQGVFSKGEVDFGSRTLIDSFAEPIIDGEILDLGCGYGPIGLSIAKSFPDRKVVLADINERALALAENNAKQNDIQNVEFQISDRLQSFQHRNFSAILTNPPIRAGKKVIYQMFDESFEALLPGGTLWIVIQKKQGAPSAITKLEELFGEVEVVAKNKGYYIIRATKAS
ncbi:class I SAM-dependent methyltransferase [Aquibacillus koreensis]|uniref:Class I SAM-dependent methyltransferase n=1 Tax=Aquibacillus koreensis TaxID=279446 RepID=A0A9X4AJW5_9BACI|nr:class I SAM-dependent methyltransferase [Aquibacillus koreensis]MCT2536611.1 class I SAM-dependent methyltransferase [Aquibacillus koreensis]MDC3422441.1 class I SAM-dependent methyltransferase [Aquibacillus koreensis]